MLCTRHGVMPSLEDTIFFPLAPVFLLQFNFFVSSRLPKSVDTRRRRSFSTHIPVLCDFFYACDLSNRGSVHTAYVSVDFCFARSVGVCVGVVRQCFHLISVTQVDGRSFFPLLR